MLQLNVYKCAEAMSKQGHARRILLFRQCLRESLLWFVICYNITSHVL